MIMGGRECRVPLFVSEVERCSAAASAGLVRADVLLELNGKNVEHELHAHACETLRSALQLTLVVKNHKVRATSYTTSFLIHLIRIRSTRLARSRARSRPLHSSIPLICN